MMQTPVLPVLYERMIECGVINLEGARMELAAGGPHSRQRFRHSARVSKKDRWSGSLVPMSTMGVKVTPNGMNSPGSSTLNPAAL
jgi:hypothetical protein